MKVPNRVSCDWNLNPKGGDLFLNFISKTKLCSSFFLKWAYIFLYFPIFIIDFIQLIVNKFAMTGFELQITGIGSDHSTNRSFLYLALPSPSPGTRPRAPPTFTPNPNSWDEQITGDIQQGMKTENEGGWGCKTVTSRADVINKFTSSVAMLLWNT